MKAVLDVNSVSQFKKNISTTVRFSYCVPVFPSCLCVCRVSIRNIRRLRPSCTPTQTESVGSSILETLWSREEPAPAAKTPSRYVYCQISIKYWTSEDTEMWLNSRMRFTGTQENSPVMNHVRAWERVKAKDGEIWLNYGDVCIWNVSGNFTWWILLYLASMDKILQDRTEK